MPIVKHKSIHTKPMSFLKYIANGDKTSDMEYLSAINTVTDLKSAYDMFEFIFEAYAHEKFYKYNLDEGNNKVRLHHYIQSFDPKDENVTPEIAHKIGLEWARKVFGNETQILCATHVDKKHIHNHFAVAPYSNSGKHHIDNMATLNRTRKISDEICKSRGVSIIENPLKDRGMKYKEYAEARHGSSWKGILRYKIDLYVVDENCLTLDDLLERLRLDGYKIRRGKYITVTPPNAERGARLHKLGEGYSERDIEFRLQNRDREWSLVSVMEKYKGIQVEYALVLQKIQMLVYRKLPNPKRCTVRDVQQLTDVLMYMFKHDINQINSFENRISDLTEKYNAKSDELKDKESKIERLTKLCDDYEIHKILSAKVWDEETQTEGTLTPDEQKEFQRTYNASGYNDREIAVRRKDIAKLTAEVEPLSAEVAELKADKNEASKMLATYNCQMQDSYSAIVEQVRAERQAREDAEKLRAEEIQRRQESEKAFQERLERQARENEKVVSRGYSRNYR